MEEKDIKKIIKDFSKGLKSEVISISTFKKISISKMKAKLISYAT
jgi:GTP-binding protein